MEEEGRKLQELCRQIRGPGPFQVHIFYHLLHCKGPYYVIFSILVIIILYLIYDSFVNPQEFVTASMTGLD